MNKRIVTGKELQALYPPMPEEFATRMEQMLAHSPQPAHSQARRASTGLVVAALIVLLAAGALAAAIHWNVMEYLFGGERPQADGLIRNLETSETKNNVTLSVDSALCDGELLAIDWTVTNQKPEQPVYLQVDSFTANGIVLHADDADDFDCNWLMDDNDTLCGGETVALPEEVGGNTLHVEIKVGVYQPKAPVYRIEEFDADTAAEKSEQGYYVIAEEDGLVEDDPEEGWLQCYGSLTESEMAQFNRSEINVTFDLDLREAQTACKTLTPEQSYQNAVFTAEYTRAVITPAALYLQLEMQPVDDDAFNHLTEDGSFLLTDGTGGEIDAPFPDMEVLTEEQPDGTRRKQANFQWIGLNEEDLPDIISLSWRADDGDECYIQPISIRP